MLSGFKGFRRAAVVCVPFVLSVSAFCAPAPKGDATKGQDVFTSKCFQCHSVQPDQVKFGPSLYGELKKPHPKRTDAEVRGILKNGKNKMPSFDGKLTEEETDNLLAYLHTL